jgi:microcompartment protein CcmL/EutN
LTTDPRDALALLEVDAVASGLRTLDVMVKRSPVHVLEANLVEPGRFLILFDGGVAEVAEAFTAGVEQAGEALVGQMMLPFAHAELLEGLRGREIRTGADGYDTLGVVEGTGVAALLEACDRALKEALVTLTGIRVAGALGGRAFFVVQGEQHDVESALESGARVLEEHGRLHRTECIARPHADMVPWLLRPTPFHLPAHPRNV